MPMRILELPSGSDFQRYEGPQTPRNGADVSTSSSNGVASQADKSGFERREQAAEFKVPSNGQFYVLLAFVTRNP